MSGSVLNAIPSLLQLNERLDRRPVPSHTEASSTKGWVILGTGTVIATAAAAVALKVINVNGWGKDPWIGTLLPFVAGACLQQAFQSVTPRKWSNIEKTFLADYAVPIFLIATQIYANIPYVSPEVKEGIYGALTAHAGLCFAAFVHTLVTRRLAETEDNLPLMGGTSEESPQKLKLAVLSSSNARFYWAGIKVLGSVGLMVTGSLVKGTGILRDYGVILAGDGVAQILSEAWLRRIVPMQEGFNQLPLESQHAFPKELKLYYRATKIFLALAHSLPGALIVMANALEKTQYSEYSLALSIPCLALTGIFTGGKRNIERARFTEVPVKELSELKKPVIPLTTAQTAFSVFKWVIATAGVGGFIGLGIAGFDFGKLTFENPGPIIQGALASFGACLYGSYALAEIAKRKFNPDENSWLKNHLYFVTHYSQSIPRYALFIMNKMQIGDDALSGYDIPNGLLVSAAYADLGYSIGIEANSRGEFQMPTVLTSLAAGLFGKFIVSQFLNQA